ncbi:MAG: heme-binding protein [Deltaproteobacteria bacterium]|nr:heme-binding protein [Deltaproteobacteria bacterium]MBI3388158.1 heme-binding protein [Deltaproteobacteria bacterium]
MTSSVYRLIALPLTILIAGASASAQIIERKGLTLDGANLVIAAATAEAKKLNAPGGVIAVVDDGGNLMALARLDGTFAAGANISIGKARTAVLFKKPTKVFEDIINKGRTAMTALNDFTPLQGGIPIEVDGAIVGGVGVSGAASAAQDEELAIAGAAAAKSFMTAASASVPPAVSFFNKDAVAQAFAKGAVLFDGAGRNYMVHASRRDKPGLVEIHTKDTDIIYVLDGGATFVTGGTIVDGKSTEPDEIRGASIRDGDTRHIAKGDVIIVPNGTPHWFREVPGVLTYYVVKVR